LAFKDLAMQALGGLFDTVLKKRGERLTIIGATSGDTGGAAIEAMRGRKSITTFILHPQGRVSDVQRRMMTTVQDPGIHNIAIEGTFDDCQTIVKGLFNDHEFRDAVSMGGVNSINWARIMAQVVYYFAAGVALGSPHRAVSFSVPTGNFGDIFAGYAAAQMGLPVEQLIIGTNVNDILARTLSTGQYSLEEVVPTSSPSMDIQISSNFERLIFEVCDRDPSAVTALMGGLAQSGSFTLPAKVLKRLQADFSAERVDEADVASTVKAVLANSAKLIDPHTAVGVAAGRKARKSNATPLISLSTAHPAKFPDSVEAMSGVRPALPPELGDLFERQERFEVLPNEIRAVRSHIEESLSKS
jgi:threonine synthase